jgi:hypothetical protein
MKKIIKLFSTLAFMIMLVQVVFFDRTFIMNSKTDNVLSVPQAEAANHICGMQLNDADVTFCDTFDTPKPGQSRAGDLDPNVWGVSRLGGDTNIGQNAIDFWAPTSLVGCNGTTTVLPPNDVKICNGQLRQALDDQHSVLVLAMYPKQPFDYAGRTGTVSFDVTNDTNGGHAAWPEFWLTDAPVPAPFTHSDPCDFCSLARNSFGIRFEAAVTPGQFGLCPNGNNINQVRWTVGSMIVSRNWVEQNIGWAGDNSNPNHYDILDCVVGSSGPNGAMNHVEIRVSQNQIEVWASDPGSSQLRIIARKTNANLSLTRGLIWIEDAHYNATKGFCQSDPAYACQTQHTFSWDNVAFDGPFTYRDFSYDALDANVPRNGGLNLGKLSLANQTATWDVLNMPANPQAAAARVLFNLNAVDYVLPDTLIVTVNGHPHPTPWPYPTVGISQTGWKTLSVTIPVTDLVAGTNTVQLGANVTLATGNVNIVLVDVPGGVPVLPGSINSYPGSTTPPNPTPIVGDINLDHIVNSIDYSILNSKWFTSDANSDLNHDGLVNAIDFSLLNSNWFKTW